MMVTTLAFSADLDSMMSSKDKKNTGYDSLTPEEKKNLNRWISEHFSSHPDPIGSIPLSLSINIDNGRKLQLSDGSFWEIDPVDQKTSSVWLTPFPLEITPSDSKTYPFTIQNLTSQESVKARKASS
jgi:hypothetical protein